MRRSARWAMLTAGLLVAASGSAHAADDKATREAEARFAEGLSRVKKQDYDAARLSFEQAYTVLHRPLILWNLALSEEKSGHPLDALAHFRQVSHDATSQADRTSAQKHVEALSASLGRIEVQAPAGTAFVLDGTDVGGTAPLSDPLDVMPGHHAVVAKLTTGTTKTSEVDAPAGQVTRMTFVADAPALTAMAPVAPPTTAAAPTDAQPPSAPPTKEQAQDEAPFWTPRTVTAVTLGTAAVVAAGFAAGFGLASRSNENTAATYQKHDDACAPGRAPPSFCGKLNDAINAQNRDANVSNALYFVGGAFAVGAVVSWFFWPKQGHGASAWVVPAVGAGTAGLHAEGRF